MRLVLLTALIVVSCTAPSATPAASEPPGTASPAEALSTATASPAEALSSSTPRIAETASPGPAGAVPDAGILFFSIRDRLLRYDGASGRLEDIGYGPISVQAETAEIVYAQTIQGGRKLLRWDGSADNAYDCGLGGFISFSAAGACATFGSHMGPGPGPFTTWPTPPVWVRLPGDRQARVLLLQDWGALSAWWSPDSTRLAVIRVVPPYPEGNQFFQTSLWIVEADGSARMLYRPAPGRGLPTRWSPDGRYLMGWDAEPGPSAYDKPSRLLLIDVATGRLTDLGSSLPQPDWLQWSADGRLAFVRGAGAASWRDKQVVVREPDGSERIVTPPGAREVVGLAPAWDPAGGRLAWIAGPSGDGSGYLEGTGVGDRRAFVSDRSGDAFEIRCPGRVVEGVRWSRDGEALLLLCRRPGATSGVFELWLYRFHPQGRAAVEFITSLGWDSFLDLRGGFAASLFTYVGWSRAVR